MKKVLLASTALVMSAGFAAADVSVGGDGRMGVQSYDGEDLEFESRIRISFSASGETDAGLAFGGSIRADNSNCTGEDTDASGDFDACTGGGDNGFDGNVFIEGTFGKISMGDVSGAPEAAVGDLSGVGLTGLGDFNELTYLSNGDRPAARWDYTVADFGVHVSMDDPGESDDNDAYGIAITYSTGDLSFGLGYESTDDADGAGTSADHIVAGVTAGFGDATFKVAYGDASDIDFTQMGVSVDYVTGPTTLTAFWINKETDGVSDEDSYGVGVAYDLGGGASIKAGVADTDSNDDPNYDFGISMSF